MAFATPSIKQDLLVNSIYPDSLLRIFTARIHVCLNHVGLVNISFAHCLGHHKITSNICLFVHFDRVNKGALQRGMETLRPGTSL